MFADMLHVVWMLADIPFFKGTGGGPDAGELDWVALGICCGSFFILAGCAALYVVVKQSTRQEGSATITRGQAFEATLSLPTAATPEARRRVIWEYVGRRMTWSLWLDETGVTEVLGSAMIALLDADGTSPSARPFTVWGVEDPLSLECWRRVTRAFAIPPILIQVPAGPAWQTPSSGVILACLRCFAGVSETAAANPANMDADRLSRLETAIRQDYPEAAEYRIRIADEPWIVKRLDAWEWLRDAGT